MGIIKADMLLRLLKACAVNVYDTVQADFARCAVCKMSCSGKGKCLDEKNKNFRNGIYVTVSYFWL